MSKVILQSFLGILFSFAGVYLLYLYILSIDSGGSLLFLILSLLLIAAGVFFFIRAGKIENIYTANVPKGVLASENKADAAKRLAKNNELLGDWKKTNETKDRLRMLEISASAGDSDS